MSLPPAAPQRQLKHRRNIEVRVFARDDGLSEVDATRTDVKTRTAPQMQGPREAGRPIHDMLQDFRKRSPMSGGLGCTHITEPAQILATTVVQGFVGEVLDKRGPGGAEPFHIDRCHSLMGSGEAMRLHGPRWSVPAPATAS